MLKKLLIPLAVGSATAHGQVHWLTVTGDRRDPAVDTVEVAPESVVALNRVRLMTIRTSRSAQRVTYDGLPYRSYFGNVRVDCEAREARFDTVRYFQRPFWAGESRDVQYALNNAPLVAFRDVQPNPVARIVQAACQIGTRSPR